MIRLRTVGFSLFCALSVGALTTACGPEDQDANNDTSIDEGMDMTVQPVDMGSAPQDLGSTPEKDADVAPEDAGTEPEDAGAEPEDAGSQPDLAEPEDMGTLPDAEADLIVIGDLGTGPEPEDFPCYEELKQTWPLNTGVTPSGSVTEVSDDGGVKTVAVSATAGGLMNALNEAFVYVDLDTATLVSVDDIDALGDTTWDLAFKRVVIRSNGGSSGIGKVAVAKLSGTTFDQVQSTPSDATFVTEENVDETCTLTLDPINTPYTVFNQLNTDNASGSESWYAYGGPGGVSPLEEVVYLVRNAEDTVTFKLEIVSWMGGDFSLRWAVLP